MVTAVRSIELRLFGEPALLVGGACASFAGFPRLPALLAYLALNEGAPRREQIAFTLWPDELESAARANLRRALHRLQTLLGPQAQALQATTTTLALSREGVRCDLWDFETLLAEQPPSRERLDRAIELYGRGLLPSVDDEWLVRHRERAQDKLLDAIGSALEASNKTGDAASVCRYARAMLGVDPFREEALRALMLALAQSGDRAGALVEYRDFVERLRREFGVEPDPETASIYTALAKREASPKTHNLPFESDPFIGRSSELERLCAAYASRRAATICGAPGVGKSRLALHFAHDLRAGGMQAWYVQLAPARDREGMLDAALAALRVLREPGEDAADTLCRALAEREALLLFDSAERVVEPLSDLVTALLTQCAHVRVLITSREPLKAAWEAAVRIEPMSVGEAKALLTERVTAAAGPRAARDEAALGTLCRALENNPLAIELAAARAAVFPLARLAERTQGGSLEATIAWSYDLLSAGDQQCLRGLAVFEAPWELEAAAHACGGTEHTVENAVVSLVEKSFAHCFDARSGRRYALYESVRAFALQRVQPQELDAATESMAAYYRDAVPALTAALAGPAQAQALDALDDERPNIEGVLRYADGCSAAWGAQLALALHRYWLTRGSYAQALHWMERFAPDAAGTSSRVRCFACAAVLATLLGHVDRAEQDLALARECAAADDEAQAELHHAAGVLAHERGNLRAARSEFVQSLQYARAAGEEAKAARALDNIGTEDTLLGDSAAARAALFESLAIYQKLNNAESVGWVLYHLAGLAFQDGDYERALDLNAQSLEIRREIGHRYGIALCFEGMGKAKYALRRFDEARRDYQEALRLWQAAGQRSSSALALDALAAIAVENAHYDRAGTLSEAAQRIRNDLNVGLRPYEQRLHERYRAAAELAGGGAFEAGRARAGTLGERRCIELALSEES